MASEELKKFGETILDALKEITQDKKHHTSEGQFYPPQ